ncbi:MAG: hypothetical protein LBH43_00875, partial [Treponema sp.]|nr:hypothetical protein [Treponema sp.]
FGGRIVQMKAVIMEELGQIYPLNLHDQVSIREREREREREIILQFPVFVKRYSENIENIFPGPFGAYFAIAIIIP